MISSDPLSRLLDSLGSLVTHGFPGPECHGWSVLMIRLWDPVQGEVLQCQRERISAGETEAEKSSFPKDRSPCAWEGEERNHFTWGLG